VHKEGGLEKASKEVPFTREQVQRYIRFARTINPIISPEAAPVLVECFRMLRSNDLLGKNKTAYRITVRQLESLVRLSEALARLHLDEHVRICCASVVCLCAAWIRVYKKCVQMV
jgi:DNA replication licensing factor MCM6